MMGIIRRITSKDTFLLHFYQSNAKYAITCYKNNEKLQVLLSSSLYLLRFTLVTIVNTIINAVKAAASLVTDQSYQNIKLSQLRSISGILLASFLAISIIGNILLLAWHYIQ